MIKNNLKKLLAERSIKVLHLSNETGIARSTINKIANNSTDKISMEVVNILCNALKVTPNEFFSYIPYDFSFNYFQLTEEEFETTEVVRNTTEQVVSNEIYNLSKCFINVNKYGKELHTIELTGVETLGYNLIKNDGTSLDDKCIKLELFFPNGDLLAKEIFESINIEFRTSISQQIQAYLLDNNDYFEKNFKLDINFPL
ncbi:helix-turn-helix domain-containing protein [Streptococcus acidominimus]|uniref:Cro/CI family transcriptional regulator n=1 Tax=Streptococcus acidominimus TaxID=1326 RepID=A0A1Q8ECV3_STRAI|nr:helix-turn-helix transcriptional regulator [Streptococcus acidominimus]OLF49628.1 hypothetical protein BU200_06390 [Streptococcus acidominimus]SUN08231.1 Cro/CI family transcriptional regulator [Streptococcus acidominimus]